MWNDPTQFMPLIRQAMNEGQAWEALRLLEHYKADLDQTEIGVGIRIIDAMLNEPNREKHMILCCFGARTIGFGA